MIKKISLDSPVFKDFSDYWYYARHFSNYQRKLISENLSNIDQKNLKESYSKGGWEEVLFRNSIFEILDRIKEEYKYDMIEIRCKVLNGKSVYVPKKYWQFIKNELQRFPDKCTFFAIGGIIGVECKENKDVILLISQKES